MDVLINIYRPSQLEADAAYFFNEIIYTVLFMPRGLYFSPWPVWPQWKISRNRTISYGCGEGDISSFHLIQVSFMQTCFIRWIRITSGHFLSPRLTWLLSSPLHFINSLKAFVSYCGYSINPWSISCPISSFSSTIFATALRFLIKPLLFFLRGSARDYPFFHSLSSYPLVSYKSVASWLCK